jgi:hypothetical protein
MITVLIAKNLLDALRNLMGKLNKDFNDPKDQYRSYPPLKVRQPDESVHETPPQIIGVRGKKSNSIPGNKAGGNKIKGGFEAGSKSPIA